MRGTAPGAGSNGNCIFSVSAHLLRMSVATLAFAATVGMAAEPYPTRPIRFIVGPGPNSGTDIVARAIALKLTERIGQSVLVDNRPGAGGTIANASVARSQPDGYTLLFTSGSLVVHPATRRNLSYDPVRDFAPITLVGVVPQVLVVHPSLPVRNVRDLIALAKARPRDINYGSGGVGTNGHLAGELLQKSAGIQLTHVPYKGAGPAAIDVISGQIQLLFTSAVNALQHGRTGRVRLVAVTTAKRAAVIPEVPTIAESGVSGYELKTWYGVLAPAGTPRPVVMRVNEALVEVLTQPDVQKRMALDGVEAMPGTPEQFESLIRSELVRIAKIVREAGIKPQ